MRKKHPLTPTKGGGDAAAVKLSGGSSGKWWELCVAWKRPTIGVEQGWGGRSKSITSCGGQLVLVAIQS